MDWHHRMYGHEHRRCAYSDELDRVDDLLRAERATSTVKGQGAWTSEDPARVKHLPRGARRGVKEERRLERALASKGMRGIAERVRKALQEKLPDVKARVSLRRGVLLVRAVQAGREAARAVERVVARVAVGSGVIVDVRWGV